jgi:hypothetical protein
MTESLLERTVPKATTPFGGFPPYMQPDAFLASGLWPLGRTLLFQAMKERKFHNFLMMDLTKQGVRVIDVQSALTYLKSLSDQAAADPEPALTELKLREQARAAVRARRQAKSGSKAAKSPDSRAKQRQAP